MVSVGVGGGLDGGHARVSVILVSAHDRELRAEARELDGSEDAYSPFWSPDGTQITFRAEFPSRDIYVMDAFGTSHRAQASTEGVTRFAPKAAAGLLLSRELDALE